MARRSRAGSPVAAIRGPSASPSVDEVGTGKVNHSGTFNANVMGCAAVVATLGILTDDPPYARIEAPWLPGLPRGSWASPTRSGIELNLPQGLPVAQTASIGGIPVAFDLQDRPDPGPRRVRSPVTAAGGRRGVGRRSWHPGISRQPTTMSRIDTALERAVDSRSRTTPAPALDFRPGSTPSPITRRPTLRNPVMRSDIAIARDLPCPHAVLASGPAAVHRRSGSRGPGDRHVPAGYLRGAGATSPSTTSRLSLRPAARHSGTRSRSTPYTTWIC